MDWILWVYRHVYRCRRSIIKQFCPTEVPYEKVTVHADSLPWMWIGMKYEDDSIITATQIVNHEVQYGDHVTPEYLTTLTGLMQGRWYYVEAKTLEEKVFPSEGFVIEDVLDKSLSDSE